MNLDKFNKPRKELLKKSLTILQFNVTQNNATEKPFENQYFANEEPGIYVDIVSGEPLFSSLDKYNSGCGWPAFTKPLIKSNIIEKADFSYGMHRIEVRSKFADSHLGHVFSDGPVDSGGLRYCINSASIKFIHKNNLEEEGYVEFLNLFK